jgi:hypothetical protein
MSRTIDKQAIVIARGLRTAERSISQAMKDVMLLGVSLIDGTLEVAIGADIGNDVLDGVAGSLATLAGERRRIGEQVHGRMSVIGTQLGASITAYGDGGPKAQDLLQPATLQAVDRAAA